MTVSVLSPADPASVVPAGVKFREECGDGVGVPGDYDCVCDELTEAASLAKHVGGVPIAWTPPADKDSVLTDGMSYVEQCQECGGLPKSVRLLPTMSVLARTLLERSFLCGQLFSMLGAQVSVSSLCTYGFFGGQRWDRVAMDILDMSVPTEKGNRYVLVIVDCFSRWTEACPLPNKMAWLSLTRFSN